MSRVTGNVKWYDSKKGYGFITLVTPELENTGNDFFVHYSNINISEGNYKVSAELLLSWDGNINPFLKKFKDNIIHGEKLENFLKKKKIAIKMRIIINLKRIN